MKAAPLRYQGPTAPRLTHGQDLLALGTLVLHPQASRGVVTDLLAHGAVIVAFWRHRGKKGPRGATIQSHTVMGRSPRSPRPLPHYCLALGGGSAGRAGWTGLQTQASDQGSLRRGYEVVPGVSAAGRGLPSHHLPPRALSCLHTPLTICTCLWHHNPFFLCVLPDSLLSP